MSAADISVVSNFRIPSSKIEELIALGFDKAEIFNIVAPRRTLQRRIKNDALLNLEESDRFERLKRISQLTDIVFGSREKAHRWLRKPNRSLEGAKPIDLLVSETGAYKVQEVLGRIQFGMYS